MHTAVSLREHPQVLLAAGRIQGVLFDFNGTLSDDEPLLLRIYQELFGEVFGMDLTEHEYLDRYQGHSDRECIRIAARSNNPTDEFVEQLLDRRRHRYEELVVDMSPLPDQAQSLVELLHDAGVPFGIVTGAYSRDLRAALSTSRIGHLFAAMVTEEEVSRSKPDPEGYLLGARRLGLDPAGLVAFEDSGPGVLAALAAGLRTVAVTGGGAPVGDAARANAWVDRLSPDLLMSLTRSETMAN